MVSAASWRSVFSVLQRESKGGAFFIFFYNFSPFNTSSSGSSSSKLPSSAPIGKVLVDGGRLEKPPLPTAAEENNSGNGSDHSGKDGGLKDDRGFFNFVFHDAAGKPHALRVTAAKDRDKWVERIAATLATRR